MAPSTQVGKSEDSSLDFSILCEKFWLDRVALSFDQRAQMYRVACEPGCLIEFTQWLEHDLGYTFATLVADESPAAALSLAYIFYCSTPQLWISVEIRFGPDGQSVPSLAGLARGPSIDWHEREINDLFGVEFEGHPRLGAFVLHEDWPESVHPMRRGYDASAWPRPSELDGQWQPLRAVVAPGAFAMPVGPVFSDFAESAHFLLETVGEDVIRTIPRFFYKYRGMEKIVEGEAPDRALLKVERFSGTSAFAHALAFCQAVETICRTDVPPRALALRTAFAELERLRYHTAVISGICSSTALIVAASQAALIEEDLLRLTCEVSSHRYFFGTLTFGGMMRDLPSHLCSYLVEQIANLARRLHQLHAMLRLSSSFLDRLEEVGKISREQALSYGLVGPIARASGLSRDIRKLFRYAAYENVSFGIPNEQEGDGYARLRVFFEEAEQSVRIILKLIESLPDGPIRGDPPALHDGVAFVAVEAPAGAAFHWLRLAEGGTVARYHVTPPSFTNWHGFHLAAENFAFQDFPIILASFGLCNAECDR